MLSVLFGEKPTVHSIVLDDNALRKHIGPIKAERSLTTAAFYLWLSSFTANESLKNELHTACLTSLRLCEAIRVLKQPPIPVPADWRDWIERAEGTTAKLIADLQAELKRLIADKINAPIVAHYKLFIDVLETRGYGVDLLIQNDNMIRIMESGPERNAAENEFFMRQILFEGKTRLGKDVSRNQDAEAALLHSVLLGQYKVAAALLPKLQDLPECRTLTQLLTAGQLATTCVLLAIVSGDRGALHKVMACSNSTIRFGFDTSFCAADLARTAATGDLRGAAALLDSAEKEAQLTWTASQPEWIAGLVVAARPRLAGWFLHAVSAAPLDDFRAAFGLTGHSPRAFDAVLRGIEGLVVTVDVAADEIRAAPCPVTAVDALPTMDGMIVRMAQMAGRALDARVRPSDEGEDDGAARQRWLNDVM